MNHSTGLDTLVLTCIAIGNTLHALWSRVQGQMDEAIVSLLIAIVFLQMARISQAGEP